MADSRWRLINVILLGLGFMLVFTAFQTTSMISKYVTISLKEETKNTTEFREIYDEKTNNEDFMSTYSEEKNSSIVSEYRKKKPESNLTDLEIIDDQIENDIVSTLYGDGYISLSLVYGIFALANFCSPAVVKVFGHKATMFVSGLAYLMYICMYLKPTPIFMYTASIILGFGAAFIWTAQGEFLHLQSDSESLMARNTGIFWCMFQSSLIIGNVYVFIAWKGASYVSSEMRNSLFSIFAVLASIGCGMFLFLRGPCCSSPPSGEQNEEEMKTGEALLEKASEKKADMIFDSIKNAFKLLFTKEIILIASLFLYSGFELSFFSGVYTTSVGNSKNLENPSSAVGLVGMCIGVGEVFGGGLFVFGSKLMDKIKRPHLLILCLLLHFGAFALVMCNIPLNANISSTDDLPLVFPNTILSMVLVTAFMLGLGDAGVNNVIYTTISTVWHHDSAPAFALMKERSQKSHIKIVFEN